MGPFGDIEKMQKKSHKAEKSCAKNFWSWAGLEPVLLLSRPQKISKKSPEPEDATLVRS